MLETIRSLPSQPGVYQYFDGDHRLLYIGKAKNLKNRVKSYWHFTPHLHPAPALGARITKMLHEAVTIEYLLTPSEEDALILENSLIKQLKPKYNILLRDDKTYPYIYIDLSLDYPRFELTRKVIQGKQIKYFGPFPTGGRALLDALYEIYPLVQRRSGLAGGKACLFHQIGKCPAPCEKKITPSEYHQTINQAIESIRNRKLLTEHLSAKMMRLAQEERFEEAAKIRDTIEAIEGLKLTSDIDLANDLDLDIFAIQTKGDRGVVVRLFMRQGRIASTSHSFFRQTELYDQHEAYRQAIIDLYSTDIPALPSQILTADLITDTSLASAINHITGRHIPITHPQRGAKKRLIDLARTNADELLKTTDNNTHDKAIESAIAELLGLSRPPYRVEIFDNSHMMGSATVGGMVVWNDGEWDKKHYRHYKLQAKDEYAQMKEMLSRRIEEFATTPPPDLWLLDGGETLRRLAQSLLHQAGVNLDVAAIAKEKLDAKAHRAKGAAMDVIYTANDILTLQASDKRLQWCQRLRDEAHRFAITYHQKLKRKQDTQISLLRKKGIGPATLKKLLNHFGTFEAIKQATQSDLEAIVNKKVAATILDTYNTPNKTL